jgi:hydroxymethylglutaryl-CoA lyase
MSAPPGFVRIFEMGPRDGLQNEKRIIATQDKVRLVDLLSDCGFTHIEAASFVSPKWVPQMADSGEVLKQIRRRPGTRYTALTPNLQGYRAAREANADAVAIFGSASETFSQRNINCTIAESYVRFAPVVEAALADGVPVRGYVSCVTDCPYEGPVDPHAAADAARRLFAMGCEEISLGDTIGRGTPHTIARMLDAVLERVPANRLAGHYHDTGGMALENIAVSLEKGIRVFDAAVGGLGGCPYAPGAKGNVDTIAVNAMLERAGFETGLDASALQRAADFARTLRSIP